ncbi:unnamed protein product [Auanema sp. JU1783]|nr:unnamed protein product [Auanema sp. JU1783]
MSHLVPFILFITVTGIFCCPCAQEKNAEATAAPTPPATEFDWNTADRIRLAQNALFSPPKIETPLCGDGWEVMKESCYYIERDEKLSFDLAEKKCRNLGASLFVANTKEEYELLTLDAPQHYFTWTGLSKNTETEEPHWTSAEGLDINEINWLSKPYSQATNGWTTVSQCAAHFNPSTDVGKYTFWYPCSYSFYYICERNATLVN